MIEKVKAAEAEAAAPDLYEALEAAVRKLDTCERSYRMGGGREFADSIANVMGQGLAALAKARGEQP